MNNQFTITRNTSLLILLLDRAAIDMSNTDFARCLFFRNYFQSSSFHVRIFGERDIFWGNVGVANANVCLIEVD